MPTPEDKPALQYDNILVTTRGIAEIHGRKVVIFVPAADIDRLTLKFGRSDHRPKFTLSISLILAAAGLYGLVEFFLSPRGFRIDLGMIALGIIGGSMIFDTLKQRYYFEIQKKRGHQRLVLTKNAQKQDLEEFCDKLRSTYQYEITDLG